MKRIVLMMVALIAFFSACSNPPDKLEYKVSIREGAERLSADAAVYRAEPGGPFVLDVQLFKNGNKLGTKDLQKFVYSIKLFLVDQNGDTLLTGEIDSTTMEYKGKLPTWKGDLIGYIRPYWKKSVLKTDVIPGIFSEPFWIRTPQDSTPPPPPPPPPKIISIFKWCDPSTGDTIVIKFVPLDSVSMGPGYRTGVGYRILVESKVLTEEGYIRFEYGKYKTPYKRDFRSGKLVPFEKNEFIWLLSKIGQAVDSLMNYKGLEDYYLLFKGMADGIPFEGILDDEDGNYTDSYKRFQDVNAIGVEEFLPLPGTMKYVNGRSIKNEDLPDLRALTMLRKCSEVPEVYHIRGLGLIAGEPTKQTGEQYLTVVITLIGTESGAWRGLEEDGYFSPLR
jgi:hypothetical protein